MTFTTASGLLPAGIAVYVQRGRSESVRDLPAAGPRDVQAGGDVACSGFRSVDRGAMTSDDLFCEPLAADGPRWGSTVRATGKEQRSHKALTAARGTVVPQTAEQRGWIDYFASIFANLR